MAYLDDLAARHGVPYRFAVVPEGHRAYLMGNVVILNQTLTPERAHWAYCHEVAHLLLHHPALLPIDESAEIEQENEANRLASELLLPDELILPHIQHSLLDLKQTFPFASHEVLARRRQLFRSGLLTIFDNGKMTTRLAPDGWSCPANLFPLEQQALKECYTNRSEVILDVDGMKVEGTYVDEGRGVLRVILFLEGDLTE
ncbi:MAG: ImmA/IrrE family metallo-endopeptidase [bacterium]|nr:ImmA/IrrE family metallo-endopeptidase [bacterium]